MPSVCYHYSVEDLRRQFCLEVMVEAWDKKNYGRVRRAYLNTFNESERRCLGKWQARARRWWLVSGYPRDGVVFRSERVIHLLERACHFFATI